MVAELAEGRMNLPLGDVKFVKPVQHRSQSLMSRVLRPETFRQFLASAAAAQSLGMDRLYGCV